MGVASWKNIFFSFYIFFFKTVFTVLFLQIQVLQWGPSSQVCAFMLDDDMEKSCLHNPIDYVLSMKY